MNSRFLIAALMLSALALAGCAQQPGPPYNGGISVSELVSNSSNYLNSKVSVSGYLDDAVECTLMACISERACCNSCGGTLSDLMDNSIKIGVSGKDCAFPRDEGRLITGQVALTGVWDGRTLRLESPEDGSGSQKNSFELGKAFSVTTGKTYTEKDKSFELSVELFADSRCKEGNECFWEGEQGINLRLWNYCPPDALCKLDVPVEIYLGEKTAKEANAGRFGVKISLESINVESKTAKLLITKTESPSDERQWFSIAPVQCEGNAWDEWYKAHVLNKREPTEKEIVGTWLNANGIEIYGYASKQFEGAVCAACGCPTGETIAVLVDSSDAAKMESLGWNKIESIACTEEAKLCPDGSGVGRAAPFCEFEECPDTGTVTCPKDLFVCPNGLAVGRTGPDCEFVCTDSGKEAFIVKEDVPGFVPAELYKHVKTTIYSDGSVEIESTDYRQEVVSLERKQLSGAELEGLKTLVRNSNFFSLTEEDTRICIADAPTENLEVRLDGKSNSVSGIGSECDREKLGDSREIIAEINELAGQ